ncbi:PHD finger protein 24-like isoform X2 [Dendronephthya gigantea]|uniref:PHD finger protein 24-like isoform X2 n=1 Tax=Dendronephthya gigantea TaxID=151771 RepID=UPI00106B0E3B|nr:PHD finger protein 24-like isoform X2 [Dendronephthya gigantea]
MGTGASKARKKNKVRQNALVVGSLQVNAQRSRDATNHTEPEEETKPISLVDTYEVNDSLLFKGGTSGQFVPYFKAWLVRVEADELCSICSKYNGKKVFPCRVCTRVFHEGCLQKTRKLNDKDSKDAFSRAGTDLGWSCHYCENITLLLSDDEMQNLIEYFDEFDMNQDTQIEKSEYVKIRILSIEKDNPEMEVSAELEQDLEREFKAMDRNDTGTIDWWEFVNHEAVKVLGRRDKRSLSKLLTKREIEKARDMFHSYDRDEDGYISSYEAMKAYERWFGQLKIPNDSSNPDWFSNI